MPSSIICRLMFTMWPWRILRRLTMSVICIRDLSSFSTSSGGMPVTLIGFDIRNFTGQTKVISGTGNTVVNTPTACQDFNGTGVRVTLIEPGMVDTPFFDSPPEIDALKADDIARAVMFAVEQPPHVDVNEILIRPTDQPN